MANQIGAFFEAQNETDLDAAGKAVAGHLKLFWAPTMRADLIAQFERGQADALAPAVVVALRDHRTRLLDTEMDASSEHEVFPEGGGDAG